MKGDRYDFTCNSETEGYRAMICFGNNWLMLAFYLCHTRGKERCKGAFKNSFKGTECFANSLPRSTLLDGMRSADKPVPGLNLARRANPPVAAYLLQLDCRAPLLQRLDAAALWATSSPGQRLARPGLRTQSLLSGGVRLPRSGNGSAGDKHGSWQGVVTPSPTQ